MMGLERHLPRLVQPMLRFAEADFVAGRDQHQEHPERPFGLVSKSKQNLKGKEDHTPNSLLSVCPNPQPAASNLASSSRVNTEN